MKTNVVMIILVIALVVLSAVQAFQINTINSGTGGSGNAVGSSSGAGGETYEQMMARMHPDQVKQAPTRYQPSSAPAMVGGC